MAFTNNKPRRLDAAARASVPGEYVELTDGVVRYDRTGPSDGPPVVLLHGFFTSLYVWDQTVDDLAQAGFDVLRYDMYGRGYSDRPETRYDADLFDRQLLELLDALEITAPINLIGPSMGGAVALVFADRHPERVRRLALFAPSGLYPKHEWMTHLMRLPGLGELAVALNCRPGIYEPPVDVPLRFRGTRRAFLSTIRHGPFSTIADVYARVGQREIPTLLIWGREDDSIPFEVSRGVREALPHTEFHAIDGAGHKAYRNRAEVVNPLLIEFMT